MQISNTTIFVFVEGRDHDPYFYGSICDPVITPTGLPYEIVAGWRLEESGGKQVLLEFFRYLSTTNSLVATFQGKQLAVFFFLDKDLDDILNSRTVSEHIVYTKHYSVENHLFAEGDLIRAAASASSLERRLIATHFGEPGEWRKRCAELWRDWLVFCVFATRYGVDGEHSYRRAFSIFNEPLYAAADPGVILEHRTRLLARSGMPAHRFNRAFRAVDRMVSRLVDRGRHDVVFSGKWYVALLEAEVDRVAAGRPYNSHGLSNRIVGAVSATLDFSGDWTEHFRTPLRRLITRIVRP